MSEPPGRRRKALSRLRLAQAAVIDAGAALQPSDGLPRLAAAGLFHLNEALSELVEALNALQDSPDFGS